MIESRAEFKRILVRLPQSTRDYAGVGVTARLADLLGLSLVATFIQDAGIVDLAALPCVRELRPLGEGWHPIELPQLARQLEHAEAAARRRFHDAVRTTRIDASFNTAKGSVAEAESSATADDIIVVIEPRNPADRITQQFTRLIDAAFGASAAVMVIPSRIARTVGPIAAIVLDSNDASFHSALAIAAAAKEKMIVLGPPGSNVHASIAEMAGTAGVQIEVGPAIREPLDVASLLTHLAHLNERLVVMSRAAVIDRGAPMVASLRGVPVLLTEPERTFGSSVAGANGRTIVGPDLRNIP